MCRYGKSSKKRSKPGKFQQHTASGSSGGSSGNAGNLSKHGGKGKKVPLPTDICWRCGKGRYQKGQDCKVLEAVCRNCSIKGHFEKVYVKGKHAPHTLCMFQELPTILLVSQVTTMNSEAQYMLIW